MRRRIGQRRGWRGTRQVALCVVAVALLGTGPCPWDLPGEDSALRREISPTKPLLIHNLYCCSDPAEAGDDVAELKNLLPADLRPYLGLQLVTGSSRDPSQRPTQRTWMEAMLGAAEEADVPAILQIAQLDGAAVFAGEGYSFDQDYLGQLFDQYSSMIGVCIAEFSAIPVSSIFGMLDGQKDALTEAIQIAAAHDGYFLWQDMGYLGRHPFVDAGEYPPLFEAIREHGEHIILQDKHNGLGQRFVGPAAILGFYLSELVGHWGVNSEEWLWWEAGFGPLFAPPEETLNFNHPDPLRAKLTLPEAQLGIDWLVDAAAGATVFSIEAPWRGLAAPRYDTVSPAATYVLFPLLRQLLRHRLIPTRTEVRDKVRIAYHPSAPNRPELLFDDLFFGLYGPDECEGGVPDVKCSRREWIPSTGRYSVLPILPVRGDAELLSTFDLVLEDLTISTEEKVELFDGVYPEIGTGDSWFVEVPGAWFIANPHENRDVRTTFGIPVDPFGSDSHGWPCHRAALCRDGEGRRDASDVILSGEIDPHTFLIVRPTRNHLALHLNNYRIDSDTQIWADPAPAQEVEDKYYTTEPLDGTLRPTELTLHLGIEHRPWVHLDGMLPFEHTEEWDQATGDLTLRIDHNGPIDIHIHRAALW